MVSDGMVRHTILSLADGGGRLECYAEIDGFAVCDTCI